MEDKTTGARCRGCDACPFSMSEKAEQAQNYGCLPSPFEIMTLHRDTGHNWACHDAEDRLCSGFLAHAKEYGIEVDKGAPLLKPSVWDREGAPKPLERAA